MARSVRSPTQLDLEAGVQPPPLALPARSWSLCVPAEQHDSTLRIPVGVPCCARHRQHGRARGRWRDGGCSSHSRGPAPRSPTSILERRRRAGDGRSVADVTDGSTGRSGPTSCSYRQRSKRPASRRELRCGLFHLDSRAHPRRRVDRARSRDLACLRPGGHFVLTVDLFLDCAPFTSSHSNQYGSNINLLDFVTRTDMELVLGESTLLCGFPDFDPGRFSSESTTSIRASIQRSYRCSFSGSPHDGLRHLRDVPSDIFCRVAPRIEGLGRGRHRLS